MCVRVRACVRVCDFAAGQAELGEDGVVEDTRKSLEQQSFEEKERDEDGEEGVDAHSGLKHAHDVLRFRRVHCLGFDVHCKSCVLIYFTDGEDGDSSAGKKKKKKKKKSGREFVFSSLSFPNTKVRFYS